MTFTEIPELQLLKKMATAYLISCKSEEINAAPYDYLHIPLLFFNCQREEVQRIRNEIDNELQKYWPGNAGERPDPMPEANG